MTPPMEPAPTAAGQRTRDEILTTAWRLASAEGLAGLTIGKLSTEVGMSKSGLFAHFGSKEDLQLATLEYAEVRVVGHIYPLAKDYDHGLPRLVAYMDGWLTIMDKSPYPGGCIMVQAAAEFDGKPGPVRDLIAKLGRRWLDTLAFEITHAKVFGQLDPHLEAGQLAFELSAFGHEGNWKKQLFGDDGAFGCARRAMLDRLARQATAKGRAILGGLEAHVMAGMLAIETHPQGEKR